MIKAAGAGIFDRVDFDNSFLRGLEDFCSFPRLGGKVFQYAESKFREGAALETEERQKNKTIEVVKAIFMIIIFPITLLIYGFRAIARSFAPERKIEIQNQNPIAEENPAIPPVVIPPAVKLH